MILLQFVGGAVALTAWLAALWVALGRIQPLKAEGNPHGIALESRLAALEVKVEGLPSLWESERKRAEKHADRARKAEANAERIRAEIDEDSDDESDNEGPRLRVSDGAGSHGGGVLPMRGEVAQGPSNARPHLVDPFVLAGM